MVVYQDPTHIKSGDIPIDPQRVSPLVEKLATYIRTKMYGVDVRESLALALELMSNIVSDDIDNYAALKKKVDQLAQDWQDDVDNMDRQYQQMFTDLTNKWNQALSGVTSDTEVIAARKDVDGTDYATLGQRLDHMALDELTALPMTATFDADSVIKVRDLSTASADLHYTVLGEMADIDDTQLAFRSLRSRNIAIHHMVTGDET